MNNKFVALFQEYGYTVEQMEKDTFIADNGVLCIPYTEYDNDGSPECHAVTIDSCYREEIKEVFKAEKKNGRVEWWCHIPQNSRIDFIANHDCMFWEVENLLKSMSSKLGCK